ncbi:alpha-galactosidase [Kribbella turkmenica]|uniref:Alpha-galactosidase n=1 Tax=Kribbella turkmenica TaxID=2530375 RepID=A0A4R4WRY0_9ACTN|nr:glycoside hydrolase family 36 protein [Kribbella turkmenica]TDD19510.1 alpha-galactosidase [Kribbella turkmenica]
MILIETPVLTPALPGAEVRVVRRRTGAGTYAVTATGPSEPGGWAPRIGAITLPAATQITGFTSRWGLEFEPVALPTGQPGELHVTAGRSTQGAVPWLAVETDSGVYVLTLHWSGNWRIATTPTGDGVRIDIELHPDGQRIVLTEGESFTLPEVSVAWGDSRPTASATLARHLAEQVPAGPPLLTEWNHWWPYEDVEITEDVFLDNAAIAAELGLEVAVLDAGWFGRPDAASEWYAERGDWHRVNTERFPHGLHWLAEQTRARGIEFGIWVEAEAVGARASIAGERPELLATDSTAGSLGYVCLGAPAGREHLYTTVSGLIETTTARWIKWDFNLDPGSGCSRDDHGHGPEDGLLRHYLGLYDVLDRLRAAYPETVFEACSSGGLRIDAGLAAHVDAFFLSDPDWTEHALTCLWGAAQLLPPRQLLHWPQSEWRGEHRFQKADYSGTLMTTAQFDTKMRAALLHRFGVSVRLTEMRLDLLQRLGQHVRSFRSIIRPLVEIGVLIPLTEQPLREEKGRRQPAYQLTAGDRHLLAGFRLPPTGDWGPVVPVGLDPDATYTIAVLDGDERVERRTGRDLGKEGLVAPGKSETSVLWLLTRDG